MDAACENTGLGVRDVWEQAINYYCDQLGIPEQMPLDNAHDPIPRPSEPAADPSALKLITARLEPNTRARLIDGCHLEGLGGQEFIPQALNAWFDHLDQSGQS
ncbi:hypothetical protein [Nonomuraea wenchangensis]|uniref:Uncharacterized protein n=1 Tax=Nonomuraea wenchangensis TaxID=568860 RepID=A0A1I0LU53_9ACTN|nr:hypothetical protein [Nonomuraea wenchangensis]SEU46885.1 hypothetical protein SAMN05421811_127170 [Nonomuraea wenchangensis]